jgi:hypothetical protein
VTTLSDNLDARETLIARLRALYGFSEVEACAFMDLFRVEEVEVSDE